MARLVGAAREYFVRSFSQPYYLWFFAASQLGLQATMPFNLYSLFYADGIGMDLGVCGKINACTYAVSFCLAYVLGALADRLHPLRLSMVILVLYGVTMVLSGAFVVGKNSFGVAFFAHIVLSGYYYTASASLNQRLLPKENFAQFASAAGLVYGGISIVLPLLLGTLLDWSGHDYRLTFWAGALMSFAALGSYAVFYRQWQAGGCAPPANPPEIGHGNGLAG